MYSASCQNAVASKTLLVEGAVKTLADFGFTAAEIAVATSAVITARTAGVMILWTGIAPTATYGHYCGPNGTAEVHGAANVAAIQMIREAAISSNVTITLGRLL